jgi:hypothetical protein
VTPAILEELFSAFAQAKGVDKTEIAGPLPASVHFGLAPATATYWAVAAFNPSPEATPQTQINFQDGGGNAVFSRQGNAAWSVRVGHVPWPCPADLPAVVLHAWGLAYSQLCVLTAPAPDQLLGLLLDTSAMPAGFVDQGSSSGTGTDTSAGRSLARATGYWVRSRSPADEDTISVFLVLFPNEEGAANYTAGSFSEAMSGGSTQQQAAVPGVPTGRAVLNAGTEGGGPGSASQPQPPNATACFTVAGVSVCIRVSDHVEDPLTIAEQLALKQYQRLQPATTGET